MYLIIYLVGWFCSAPILFAYLSKVVGFNLDKPGVEDVAVSTFIISAWPLWFTAAAVVLPLKLLFKYVVGPLSNNLLKYFK